jgi:hypothetical protein
LLQNLKKTKHGYEENIYVVFKLAAFTGERRVGAIKNGALKFIAISTRFNEFPLSCDYQRTLRCPNRNSSKLADSLVRKSEQNRV